MAPQSFTVTGCDDWLSKCREHMVMADQNERKATIRNADRILVLHHGRVVEQGRHADLLAAGGIYAKLHALQFGGEDQAA